MNVLGPQALATELTRLRAQCGMPYCPGTWTCASSYTHPKALGTFPVGKAFTVADEDALLKAADAIAAQNRPMCSGKLATPIGLQFTTVAVGMGPHTDYNVVLKVNYGSCTGGLPH